MQHLRTETSRNGAEEATARKLRSLDHECFLTPSPGQLAFLLSQLPRSSAPSSGWKPSFPSPNHTSPLPLQGLITLAGTPSSATVKCTRPRASAPRLSIITPESGPFLEDLALWHQLPSHRHSCSLSSLKGLSETLFSLSQTTHYTVLV